MDYYKYKFHLYFGLAIYKSKMKVNNYQKDDINYYKKYMKYKNKYLTRLHNITPFSLKSGTP